MYNHVLQSFHNYLTFYQQNYKNHFNHPQIKTYNIMFQFMVNYLQILFQLYMFLALIIKMFFKYSYHTFSLFIVFNYYMP